jgi:hypothetical protein
MSGGTAYLLGLITSRISGHYLPLATIAWCASFFYLMWTARGRQALLTYFAATPHVVPPWGIGQNEPSTACNTNRPGFRLSADSQNPRNMLA